jgi:hypothetical protein
LRCTRARIPALDNDRAAYCSLLRRTQLCYHRKDGRPSRRGQ